MLKIDINENLQGLHDMFLPEVKPIQFKSSSFSSFVSLIKAAQCSKCLIFKLFNTV